MKRHATKEAFLERIQELAEVNKPAIKESKIRNLGTLIDYKRAADGVAYGIVKESHNYYIKKAGIKESPDVADFAYIGGLENITEYQYNKLSEADKQRNMIFRTINEAVSLKPDKNGSKKKKTINEDRTSDEIDNAEKKLGDLDAATASEKEMGTGAEEMAAGEKEMAAGAESMPPEDDLGAGLDNETPPPEGGAEETPPEGDLGAGAPPKGGAEGMPPEGGAESMPPEGGSEEAPPEGDLGAGAGEVPPEGDGTEETPPEGGLDTGAETDEPNKEIEKVVGKLTNKIRKTEMTDAQVKSYINSFIMAFKEKLPEIEIEDRKEMANKLIKVVNQDDIDSLGDDIPQDDNEKEMGMTAEGEEQSCAECGGFGKYAESRGYNSPESFMECDDEEKTNMISGYANAHNDGQNDGDFKTIAIVITPEILEKLKGDYGHEEYTEELTPYMDSMNEASDEDKMAQLNELWGGLGALGKAAGNAVGNAAGAVGRGIGNAGKAVGNAVGGVAKGAYNAVGNAGKAVGNAVGNAGKAVGQAASNAGQAVKKTYNQGEVNPEIKNVEKLANDLGKQIAALNKRLAGSGQQPVDVGSLMSSISNQVGGQSGVANVRGTKAGAGIAAEGVIPADNVQVQPNMLREEEEEEEKKEFNFDKPETDEPEEIETDKEVEIDEPEPDELGIGEPESDDVEIDEPKKVGNDFSFAPDAQTLGGGVVKPDGAPTTAVDITIEPNKTVQITMNEAKRKLIKQIAEGVNSYMNEISKNKSIIVNKESSPKGNVVNKTGKGKDIGKQGKYMAKSIGYTKKFTKPTTKAMSESEQKLRKYVRIRLEEKAGLRKSTINESKKSTTLKKLDSMIDEQFKLFESVVKKKTVNEVLGLNKLGINITTPERVAAAFKKLDPNDKIGVDKLLTTAFDILVNPQLKSAMDKARMITSTPEKYQLLQQYVANNGGTIRAGKNSKLTYMPQQVKNTATKSEFGSGGTQGKTTMGGA